MSFTRLAGARSSSAFFSKSARPSASRRSTDSADTDVGRPFRLGGRPSSARTAAGISKAVSAADPASRRLGCTAVILASGRSRQQGKSPQRTACFSSFEGLKRGTRPPTVTDCPVRSEEHTSELQSQSNLVCRLLLEKKKISNNRLDIATNNTRI